MTTSHTTTSGSSRSIRSRASLPVAAHTTSMCRPSRARSTTLRTLRLSSTTSTLAMTPYPFSSIAVAVLSNSWSTGLSIVRGRAGVPPGAGQNQKGPPPSPCAAVRSAANASSPTALRYSAWTTRPASNTISPLPRPSARIRRPLLPPTPIACVSSARSITSSDPWNIPLGTARRSGAGAAPDAAGAVTGVVFHVDGPLAAAAVAYRLGGSQAPGGGGGGGRGGGAGSRRGPPASGRADPGVGGRGIGGGGATGATGGAAIGVGRGGSGAG